MTREQIRTALATAAGNPSSGPVADILDSQADAIIALLEGKTKAKPAAS